MKFVSDFRESNPKLHKLYVRHALETMVEAKAAADALNEHSRITSSIIAGAICKELRNFIETDAAYFEAAALLFMHSDTSEYFRED